MPTYYATYRAEIELNANLILSWFIQHDQSLSGLKIGEIGPHSKVWRLLELLLKYGVFRDKENFKEKRNSSGAKI